MFALTFGRGCARLGAAVMLAALLAAPVSPAVAQVFPMPNPPPGGSAPNPPPATPTPSQPAAPAPTPVAPARVAPRAPAPAAPQPAAAAPVAAPQAAPAARAPVAEPSPVPAAPIVAPPPTVYPTPPAAVPQPSAAQAAGAPDATQPQVAAAAPDAEGRSTDDGAQCVLDEFCFGGVLTGGVLNVFGIGLHARMEYWGIGLDYQFISLGYEEVDGDLGLVTLEGRVYPFGGPFFLSLGVAWQSIALETEVTVEVGNGIPAQRVKAEGSVTMPMFKLGLGFMGRDGFVMGIDLGFGFRLGDLNAKIETNFDDIPQVAEAKAEFEEAAEAWLEWLPFTPQLNVLRIGYLF